MKEFQIKTCFLALVILFSVSISQAQQSATNPSAPNSNQPQPELNEELNLLKAQMQMIRDYNDDLLSTIHWTLTIVTAIVLALISFSWFVNFRVAARERDALKAELSASMQEELVRQVLQIQSQIPQQVQTAIALAIGQLENDIRTLRREFGHAKCNLFKQEAKDWENQGIPANAIGCYARMAETAMYIDYEPTVNEALEAIRRLLKAGVSPGAGTTRIVTELLDKLPKEYGTEIAALRALLQQARS